MQRNFSMTQAIWLFAGYSAALLGTAVFPGRVGIIVVMIGAILFGYLWGELVQTTDWFQNKFGG